MEKKKNGTIFIFFAALLFSLGGVCVKMIPWNALSINGARCIISVCVLCVYMAVTKHRLKFTKPVLLGAFCVCGTTVLYTLANKLTTAANTIVLQYTAPVFIILLMWLIYKEKPRRLDVLTCVAVLLGIVCFFIDGLSGGGMLGNVLALISGVTYAGVFMINTSKDADPLSSVFLGHLASAVVGLPFLVQETDFSRDPLIFISILGVFQLAVAYICFCRGIATTPPVAASLVSGIEPIANPALAALIAGEMISAVSIVGGVIVVGAILVYNVIKARNGRIRVEKEED